MSIVRRAASERAKNAVTHIATPRGLGTIEEIRDEFDHYTAVLLGDDNPPWENGILTLQEVAFAYFSRACEVEGLILRGENDGTVPQTKASRWYKFRTGELQSYLAIFKEGTRLGSRRLSYAEYQQREGRFS